MTLRFVLVGLVTSLGFDLPTTQDVSAWVRSGRTTLATFVEGFDAPMPVGLAAFAAVDEPVIAMVEPALPPPAPCDDLAFAAVVDEMANEFAASSEPTDLAVNAPIIEPTPAPVVEAGVARLSDAVRLTRQAISAWTTLLGGPALVSVHP